jgi:hypothetical protein
VAGLALVAATYFLLLTNQAGVTAFMTGDRPLHVRVLAAVALVIGVPGFAWVYGSCIGRITKLLRFD